MKLGIYSAAAGVASSLIVSSAAPAAFTGLVQDGSRSPTGPVLGRTYYVCNIWACFDNQADRLLSVTQATITPLGGASLFQHPIGTATAPNSAFFPLFPTLQYDSFVTIGLKSIPIGGTDSTSLEPGAAFTAGGFSGGWFNSNPDNDQGAPGAHGSPVFAPPGQFYVLIAQLTLQNPGPSWNVAGTMLVAWKSAGATGATFTPAGFACIPSPAALALFAVAGMTARRRRA